ncbi:tryptophan synthase [Trifolium repens]|nr:tryptophan synthase [Trifolium repens]
MSTCKLQGTIVSSKFIQKKGAPKDRASAVVQAVVTRDKFKVKVPQLTTTHTPLPFLPLTEKAKEIIVETENTSAGKFGRFGGKFVPETLIMCMKQLEAEFKNALHDQVFQEELAIALRDYVGRETPLYHAQRLSEYYKNKNGGIGPDIYLKREDLNHTGSHKMNNALAQAMLAKRIGLKSVVTATGSGQHGLATASACAKLGLECTVFMADKDMDRQSSNVRLMKLLGAKVEVVNGCFKDATSEAFRCWVGDLENSYQYHLTVGVEAAGLGLESGKHSSTLVKGEVAVYHGAISYLLQDDYGQIIQPHSIAARMEYPGVGPELSFLKESGRAEFCVATDEEALDAYERLCKLEGIYPSLEAAHSFAILDKLVTTLPKDKTKVVVNCSGRGDKDAPIVFNRRVLHASWKINVY